MKRVVLDQFNGGIGEKRSRNKTRGQVVKHFDIHTDPNRLIPMPGFESLTTTADDRNKGIVALGGYEDKLYGLGKKQTNWYASGWNYRVQLTPDSNYSDINLFPIDLSNLPSGFWSNVKSDGSDIRITTVDEPTQPLRVLIATIDTNTETGFVWVSSPVKPIYIYYGNNNVSFPASDTYLDPTSLDENAGFFLPLNGNANDYSGNNSNLLQGAGFSYGTGSFGQRAISGSAQQTAGFEGTRIVFDDETNTLSFRIKVTGTPGSEVNLITYDSTNFRISLNNLRQLVLFNRADDGSEDDVTSSALTVGQTYNITCVVDYSNESAEMRIFVDGVLDGNTTLDTSDEMGQDGLGPYFRINTNSVVEIEAVRLDKVYKSPTWASRLHDIYEGALSFWTAGSQVDYTNVSPTYDYTGLWETDLDTISWETSVVNNFPIVVDDEYPVPAFIKPELSYSFITNSTDSLSGTGNSAIAYQDTSLTGGIDTSNNFQNDFSYINKDEYGEDGILYITRGNNEILYWSGATFIDDVFNPFGSASCMIDYGTDLAIGLNNFGKAYVQIWEPRTYLARELINFGYGELRGLATVGGLLIAIINSYVDNPTLSAGKPAIEFRYYLNGEVRTWLRLEGNNHITSYSNPWDGPIPGTYSTWRQAYIFYAELPTQNGTLEGMWELRGTSNGPSLSLLLDTETLGFVNYTHVIGDQIFLIHNDNNSISRVITDGTYDVDAVWHSVINPGVAKEDYGAIKKVESLALHFESLPSGATAKIEVRADGGSWAVLTEDIDSAIVLESNQVKVRGRDLEFRITSSGGAIITGLTYDYTVETSTAYGKRN